MKTFVYIDGFNLFYGCLKKSAYKWLDLRALSESLIPGHDIGEVKYFTAVVSGEKAKNQIIYHRALKSTANLKIILGYFRTRQTKYKMVTPPYREVLVAKPEEKLTDVNIAAHLIYDAAHQCFDQAMIITNDADLRGPIEMVSKKMGFPVWVFNPRLNFPHMVKGEGIFNRWIRAKHLENAQFPEEITDVKGRKLFRPSGW